LMSTRPTGDQIGTETTAEEFLPELLRVWYRRGRKTRTWLALLMYKCRECLPRFKQRSGTCSKRVSEIISIVVGYEWGLPRNRQVKASRGSVGGEEPQGLFYLIKELLSLVGMDGDRVRVLLFETAQDPTGAVSNKTDLSIRRPKSSRRERNRGRPPHGGKRKEEGIEEGGEF